MTQLEPTEVLNLAGVACPKNSAIALLKLEGMDPGTLLEITVDDGEPIKNLPVSLEAEGHEILKKEKEGLVWKILVKKS